MIDKTKAFEAAQAAMPDGELIERVKKEYCQLAETYGNSHRMSIPPMVTDTDMLFGEITRRYEALLKERDHYRAAYEREKERREAAEAYLDYLSISILPVLW